MKVSLLRWDSVRANEVSEVRTVHCPAADLVTGTLLLLVTGTLVCLETCTLFPLEDEVLVIDNQSHCV